MKYEKRKTHVRPKQFKSGDIVIWAGNGTDDCAFAAGQRFSVIGVSIWDHSFIDAKPLFEGPPRHAVGTGYWELLVESCTLVEE